MATCEDVDTEHISEMFGVRNSDWCLKIDHIFKKEIQQPKEKKNNESCQTNKKTKPPHFG